MFRSGGAGDPMPWGMAVLLAIALPAAGVLLIVGGRRAREGRLRRNHFIGIRTTLTLNSEKAWDAAHVAGGHLLSVAGFGPLLTGPLLLTHPSNGVGAAIVFSGIGWMLGWILAAGVVGTRAAEAALGED